MSTERRVSLHKELWVRLLLTSSAGWERSDVLHLWCCVETHLPEFPPPALSLPSEHFMTVWSRGKCSTCPHGVHPARQRSPRCVRSHIEQLRNIFVINKKYSSNHLWLITHVKHLNCVLGFKPHWLKSFLFRQSLTVFQSLTLVILHKPCRKEEERWQQDGWKRCRTKRWNNNKQRSKRSVTQDSIKKRHCRYFLFFFLGMFCSAGTQKSHPNFKGKKTSIFISGAQRVA